MNKELLPVLPYMTTQEIRFFDKFFKPWMTVLEWGCGGSTLRWAPFVEKWHCIEHDADWHNKIKKFAPDNCVMKLFNLEEPMYVNYPGYYGLLPAVNVYLIDGRRRIECREMLAKNMHPGSVLFVHDAIRYEPSENFGWYIDIIKGLVNGNHKGIRMYGKF